MATHNVGYKVAINNYKTYSETVNQSPQFNISNDYPPPTNNRYAVLSSHDKPNEPTDFFPQLLQNPNKTRTKNSKFQQQKTSPQRTDNLPHSPSNQASSSEQKRGAIIHNPYPPLYHQKNTITKISQKTRSTVLRMHLIDCNIVREIRKGKNK